MKYKVERSSGKEFRKPCKKAYRPTERVIGIEKGLCMQLSKGWEVEINSLEELHQLMDEVNEMIIIKRHHRTNEPVIEIYDDYRE